MAFSTPNCINYKYDNTVLHSLTCKDGDNLFTTQTPRDITFESYFVAGIGCVIIFLTKKFEAAVDLSDSGDLEDPFRAKKVSQNKMAEIAFLAGKFETGF